MKYPVLILAATLLAAAPTQQSQPTPPPSPPPLTDTAQPSAAPSAAASASPAVTTSSAPDSAPLATPTPNLDTIFGGPRASPGPGSKKPNAHGTPAPPPQVRKGLDGVWELEIQRGPKTDYEHMNLLQTGQTLSGTYLTKDKKKFPITGSLDEQNNVRLVVSMPDGTTILLEGRVDGTTDMLGMFTDAAERVPFTAAYRPKENWLESVNASPGGLGGGTGGPGPP
ncbi:MAG: hypothetical protein WBD74_02425 [Candidatus Aquilonibacter sp.]